MARTFRVTIVVFIVGFLAWGGWQSPTAAASSGGNSSEPDFHARVYLTESEALELQKKPSHWVIADTIVLGDTTRNAIRRRQRVRFYTDRYTIHRLYRSGETVPYRYAVAIKQPGQHEFMDLMYGVNADGTIHRIDLMVYREPQGGEVRGRRFLHQFEGRSLKGSRFRVNRDIVHIVGATISSRSVARGARKLLAVLKRKGFTR